MVLRCRVLPLISLAFHCKHHTSALQGIALLSPCRARSASILERSLSRPSTLISSEKNSGGRGGHIGASFSNSEEQIMSSDTPQLFGRFRISPEQIFHRTPLSFAMVNLRPLVQGHVLVCSNRITPLLSDLEGEEHADLWRTVRVVQRMLKQQYKCDAFNVAVQDGAAAGQSVPHCHVHILPRYSGDLENNDDIYQELEEWAPRDYMSKRKPEKLDVPADSERRDRTMQEMADEAAIYHALIAEQST